MALPKHPSNLKVYSFFWLLFWAVQQPAWAQLQSDSYELFTTRSGLSNDIVLSVTQDNRGLLWIGTNNGLCIYDGHTFQKVKGLFDEADLWQNDFRVVFKDLSGNVWCCAQSGHFAVYDSKKHRWKKFFFAFDTHKFVTNCFEDIYGGLYIHCSDNSIYQVYLDKKKLRSVQGPVAVHTISGSNNSRLTIVGQDHLHTSVIANLVSYPGKNVREDEILPKRYYTYRVDDSGTLLLASAGLIKKYDREGHLKDRIVISDVLNINTDEVVYTVFEDASGIIWVGTDFGLLKIDRRKCRFLKYTNSSLSRKLKRNYVRSIFIDDQDKIWIGYKAGLLTMLTLDGHTQSAKTDTFPFSVPGASLFTINVIRKLRSGTMLIGGDDGLFAGKITRGKRRFDIFPQVNKNGGAVFIRDVWAVLEDKEGRIWIGTRRNGLFILDASGRLSRHYINPGTSEDNTGAASVWNLLEDHKGNIWLATDDGLFKAVPGKDKYHFHFEAIHKRYTGVAGKRVWSLAEDKYGHLWMGTTDNGFSMLDTPNRRFITYNQANGFANNICGMLHDPQGFLWVSTPGGIIRFDLLQHTQLRFSEVDGLVSNNFNFNACARSRSGVLFWGTKNGMVSFHPDSVKEKTYHQALVVIRSVWLGDRLLIDDPETAQHIVLKHNQNFFSIRFALPEFSSTATHQFAYKLKGVDEQWVYTNTDPHHASYTNVPPGDYVFQVKGSADGKHWSKEAAQLSFTIKPAFWQHSLFRIVVILALLSILLLTGYRYLRTQKEKHRINQQVAELELKALQAQMNPHFVFNALNAIQHFILANDAPAAYDYLTRFSRLIRLYLESSKSRYIDLAEEVELLRLYVGLERLRFEHIFEFRLDISPALENSPVEIPTMLLQPYVENAINHGLASGRVKSGMLHITFEKADHSIKCTIDDNGIGREAAVKIKAAKNPTQKSRGMTLIHERIDTLKKVDSVEIRISIIDKSDAEGNASGTRIEINIPLI